MRADAARNRQQIVAAAQRLVESDGPSVPLDAIARAAGVGAGTLHRHFPTKEGLLGELVVDRVRAMTEELVALAESGDGCPDAGATLVSAVILMLDEGDRSAVLKASLLGAGFDLRSAAPQVIEHLRETVDVLLTRAQRAGQIRDDIDTNDLMSLVAGAFVAEQHAGNRPHRRRLAAVFLDGLRTSAAQPAQ